MMEKDTVLCFDQQPSDIDYYPHYKNETLSFIKLRFLIQDLTIRNQICLTPNTILHLSMHEYLNRRHLLVTEPPSLVQEFCSRNIHVEQSASRLMRVSLYVTPLFSLASLTLASLLIMCLGMALIEFSPLGILQVSWIWMSVSLTRFRVFSAIIV